MIGLLKGLSATISHLFTKKVTVQYPEERRELPGRSRGLIRLRLKPDSTDPRCISCTFCEQICPAIAINVVYDYKQPEKVWSLDAGAGPMLACFNRSEEAVGMKPWPVAGGEAVAMKDGCLAAGLIDADELSRAALTTTARREGVWLSQLFGIATFYDDLAPGSQKRQETAMPEFHGSAAGSPAILLPADGKSDLQSIENYAKAGGYQGLPDMITGFSPAKLVEAVSASGLRGRGGGGFPTGEKWRSALETGAEKKYIICNAHEGDPGAFKARLLLESNPHAVIEGMMIAGYATGAREGIVYITADQELARERMESAIDQAGDQGLLGEPLPGTDFEFTVRLVAVPASLIGGEETALIAALEGRRPMPRVRPPWPEVRGLDGLPTVIDNAETLATLPWMLNNSAEAFRAIGAPNAPGTTIYTLLGAVGKPGCYEATLDTTIKRLVTENGGGFTSEAQAALVGSVTGGFLSPGLFDIPLDYDSIRETGGDLGAGSISILSGDACVVDVTRQCLEITSSEACGKCVPGRLGTWRLLDIMERVTSGGGSEADLQLAEELALDIADGALCGLGRGAVRPLLTGLKFFKPEFLEHVTERRCAAGKCGLK